jgi:membrane carboxypeptidase/penicillin-binding protein PbpC
LRAVGISTLGHPAEHYGLGLTLGNGEVRLLELANAFGTLARLGVHRPYRLLLREPGAAGAGPPRLRCARAYLIADMLADNSARSAAFGLNSYLSFDFPVACKTGTSSDYRDNWALGYTPEFTVGVWVGNPDGKPMREITGVTGAAPAMHEIFTHLRAQRGTTWFTPPAGIQTHLVIRSPATASPLEQPEQCWRSVCTSRRRSSRTTTTARDACSFPQNTTRGSRARRTASAASWLLAVNHPSCASFVLPREPFTSSIRIFLLRSRTSPCSRTPAAKSIGRARRSPFPAKERHSHPAAGGHPHAHRAGAEHRPHRADLDRSAAAVGERLVSDFDVRRSAFDVFPCLRSRALPGVHCG